MARTMTTTPSRTLRSQNSTPVSANTTTTRSVRSSSRRNVNANQQQQPINRNNDKYDDDDDDDDDDEPMLQTQLPLATQREGKNEADADDEDYNDNEKAVTVTEHQQQNRSPLVKETKRTARKTISDNNNGTSTNVATRVEEDEKVDVEDEDHHHRHQLVVKPEMDDDDEVNDAHPTTIAKNRIYQYYYDLLDQEQHTIIFNRSSRISHWPILQHFWNTYPFKDYDYGRLYVRTRLCSLLVDACSEGGYSETSIVAWDSTDWKDFIDDFRLTKDACLNPNCSHIFRADDEEGPNQEGPVISDVDRQERLMQSRHRVESKSFSQKYPIIEKTCQMNMMLSPIRQSLEQQIRSGATGPPEGISEDDVKALHAAASNSDSVVVQKHLFRLFLPADDDTELANTNGNEDDEHEGPPPLCMLKNLEDLKAILRMKPLDLGWLQGRVDRLVWLWNEECFGMKEPYLEVISYHDAANRGPYNRAPWSRRVKLLSTEKAQTPPPREKGERTDILETLKRRRNALNKNHGDDPLIESRKLAAATTKGNAKSARAVVVASKNILHQGKKSNIVVQFDDSEEEEEEEKVKNDDDDDYEGEEDADESSGRRVRLPKLPKKRRVARSPSATQEFGSPSASRIYTGPPPDEGIFDGNGNVVQRHPWNEEEIAALLSGLEKHGLGKWVYIKQEYGYILRNRTTVQLKDKFRNMKKNGELPDRFMSIEM